MMGIYSCFNTERGVYSEYEYAVPQMVAGVPVVGKQVVRTYWNADVQCGHTDRLTDLNCVGCKNRSGNG